MQFEKKNKAFSVKSKLDIKLNNIPPLKEILCDSIRNLGQNHIEKQSIIYGTVLRTNNVNSRELFKDFECKQCGRIINCQSDITEYNKFKTPLRCDQVSQDKFNPYSLLNQAFQELIQNCDDKNGSILKFKKKNNHCKSKYFQPY